MSCESNLKQIGLGLHNHHDVTGNLMPTTVGEGADAVAQGFTDIAEPDGFMMWSALLLPYIEQQSIFSLWDVKIRTSLQVPQAYQAQLKVYWCPSRLKQVLSQNDFVAAGGGIGDYAVCSGTLPGVKNDLADGAFIPPDGMFVMSGGKTIVDTFRPKLRMANITDGLSNTLFCGEKHIRPISLRGKNEDRSIFGGQNNSNRRVAGLQQNATANQWILQTPKGDSAVANRCYGGPHPGVCVFIMGDGSVRKLNLNISLNTLTALAMRQDGMTIGDF
jgi:Protein of unknown function (DUF1559)